MQLLEVMANYDVFYVKDKVTPVKEASSPQALSKDHPLYDQLVDVIERIKKETTRDMILLVPKNGGVPKLLDSKIGGIPYCPADGEAPPTNMNLVIQLNFSNGSIPHIQGFPKDGVLQIFSDMEYPMNTIVRYYPKITDPKQTEEEVVSRYPHIASVKTNALDAINSPVAVKGLKKKDNLPLWHDAYLDYLDKFTGGHGDHDKLGKLRHMIANTDDLRHRISNGFGHKLGGYHAFTQTDVLGLAGNQDYELLVQVDSDKNVQWGDNGIANWFIKPSDLKRLDFGDILGNWDCY